MSWWEGALPVVTLGLGWAGSQASEVWRDSRESRRLAADRVAARDEARADRREDFELNTLTDLHSAMSDLISCTTRWHLADMGVMDTSGKPYGAVTTPDADGQLRNETRAANIRVAQLSGLCLDDEIRKAVDAAKLQLNVVSLGPKTLTRAVDQWSEGLGLAADAQALIATRIRDIYRSA